MSRGRVIKSYSIPVELANAFDQLAGNREKSAIVSNLLRGFLRSNAGMSSLDGQIQDAEQKAHDLSNSVSELHEVESDLQRLRSLREIGDSKILQTMRENKDEEDTLELHAQVRLKAEEAQGSHRAWLSVLHREYWTNDQPEYALYYNEHTGDYVQARIYPPDREDRWNTTDAETIHQMMEAGDIPWVNGHKEDCEKYGLRLCEPEILPMVITDFVAGSPGLVCWPPYRNDGVPYVK